MSITMTLPAVIGKSGLQGYLESIRHFPILSVEEEYMFSNRFNQYGDLESARKLISSHLRLAAKIAFSYRFYGLPIEDLISEANIGLMQAVKKFEPEKGNRLSTYATWWIRATINEFVLKSWSLVRIGTISAQKKLFYNLRKIKSRLGLYGENALDPENVKIIAKDLGVSEASVLEMDQRLGGDVSLNTPVYEDGLSERQDLLKDDLDIEHNLGERQESQIRSQLLAQALGSLNDRERRIIKARRLSEDPETLEVLAEKLSISRERVRQIEVKALQKLTHFVKENALFA